jgi:hypothetical protein
MVTVKNVRLEICCDYEMLSYSDTDFIHNKILLSRLFPSVHLSVCWLLEARYNNA